MFSPYMSKTFMIILAVPNKTDFPTTTGTTSTFFNDQRLFSSLFKFWYFSIFAIPFSSILQSPGIATLMMTHDFTFLSTKIKLGLLASITLSHWIIISHINLTLSSSTTLQDNARTTSLFLQGYASYTISNGPTLQLCHVFSYAPAALVFYIRILLLLLFFIIIIIIIILTSLKMKILRKHAR